MGSDEVIIVDRAAEWLKFIKKYVNLFPLFRNLDRDPYVIIDLHDIFSWSLDYYTSLINYPRKTIEDIQDGFSTLIYSREPSIKEAPKVRIYFSGSVKQTQISDIRSKHLDHLLSVDGMIKKITEVKPTLTEATFRCDKCHTMITVPQRSRKISYPKKCNTSGCRSSKFELIQTLSTYTDTQRLLIQDSPEGLNSQGHPQDLEVYVVGGIAGKLNPGQRVTINGILKAEEGNQMSTALQRYLYGLGYELLDDDYSSLEISEEEENEIKKLSQNPDLRNILIKSIAPSTYGHDDIKEAILLQQFGGVSKIFNDGKRARGDIHILMCGDPGVAKSDILWDVHRCSPKAVFASGKTSSTSGMTATVVKDDFGKGGYTLEAGAMVIADGGICCFDEMNLFDPKELPALNDGMEQQKITITKAGINATLWSRCGILGAANPKKGRFDPYAPIAEQIKLPPTTLSRFDLIFIIQDIPNETEDNLIAEHIINCHATGGEGWSNIDRSFLTKYVAYARRTITPKSSIEVLRHAKAYYVDIRSQSANKTNSPVAATPRQLQAIIRLAEANARMRLSETVSDEDVEYACQLTDKYLKEVAYDKNSGTYDIDKVTTNLPHRQREIVKIMEGVIDDICAASADGNASRREIYETLEKQHNIDRGVAEATLEKMISAVLVYQPRKGLVRRS